MGWIPHTEGQKVKFVHAPNNYLSAIIVRKNGGTNDSVNLHVFAESNKMIADHPEYAGVVENVPYDGQMAVGTWHPDGAKKRK